jgi:malate dehydrogenase (oxaloacetate-decarboxylating)
MSELGQRALDMHERSRGKLGILPRISVHSREELALAYSPGVGSVAQAIADDRTRAEVLTGKGNAVAVVSDGSAVLGLGSVGPEAALPVMEGKALLFKEFANIDAYPIVLSVHEPDAIADAIAAMAPGFAGINLEDIAAPTCFAVEAALQQRLDVPVFHDDQHGTAIVVLAGLMNALTVTGRSAADIHVVISGAGAGGVATARLLAAWGIGSMSVVDSRGTLHRSRDDIGQEKRSVIELSGYAPSGDTLADELNEADVFIGLSKPNTLTQADIYSMRHDPIIFALANPDPEILPSDAHAAGASVVATGRSDYPNQVNNVLAFPGIFRGLLDAGARTATDAIKIAAAEGLAQTVAQPSAAEILPDVFNTTVSPTVAQAVANNTHV